jgi:hypothetical protein
MGLYIKTYWLTDRPSVAIWLWQIREWSECSAVQEEGFGWKLIVNCCNLLWLRVAVKEWSINPIIQSKPVIVSHAAIHRWQYWKHKTWRYLDWSQLGPHILTDVFPNINSGDDRVVWRAPVKLYKGFGNVVLAMDSVRAFNIVLCSTRLNLNSLGVLNYALSFIIHDPLTASQSTVRNVMCVDMINHRSKSTKLGNLNTQLIVRVSQPYSDTAWNSIYPPIYLSIYLSLYLYIYVTSIRTVYRLEMQLSFVFRCFFHYHFHPTCFGNSLPSSGVVPLTISLGRPSTWNNFNIGKSPKSI